MSCPQRRMGLGVGYNLALLLGLAGNWVDHLPGFLGKLFNTASSSTPNMNDSKDQGHLSCLTPSGPAHPHSHQWARLSCVAQVMCSACSPDCCNWQGPDSVLLFSYPDLVSLTCHGWQVVGSRVNIQIFLTLGIPWHTKQQVGAALLHSCLQNWLI